MSIIPWVEWTVENHLYITHRDMQSVTRAALMVLARHGICKELSQIIIAKFAELVAESQLVLSTPVSDGHFRCYGAVMKRVGVSGV